MDDEPATTASGGAPVTLASRCVDPNEPDGVTDDETDIHSLVVVGHGVIHRQHRGPLVAPATVLAAADITSLGQAVRTPGRCCAESPEPIYTVNVDPALFDVELFEADPVRIEVDEVAVHACLSLIVNRPGAEGSTFVSWLQPAVQVHGCEIASVRLTDESGAEALEVVSSWPTGFEKDAQEYLAAERLRPRIADVRVAPLALTVQ